MFSDARIQELAADFVCVKVDPNEKGVNRGAYEYKATGYVPEVVFVSPDGVVLERLQHRTVDGVAATMESVLEAVRE